MKKKAPKYPIHRMGKRCGYEELADGSISVAPTYSQRFDDTAARKVAVHELLRSVTKHCSDLLAEVKAEEANVWAQITDDYGLDHAKYRYAYYNGNLTKVAEKEEDQK